MTASVVTSDLAEISQPGGETRASGALAATARPAPAALLGADAATAGSPPPTYSIGRAPSLSRLPAGHVLFVLDAVLVALLWPLLLWDVRPAVDLRLAAPLDLRALLYPAADLLLLYAMGLYRRDALLQLRVALPRMALAVGAGAVLALLAAATLSTLDPLWFWQPDRHTQVLGFALALAGFTGAGIYARLLVKALQRRQVLRRRLLVVGAGQRAWDLLRMVSKEGSSLTYETVFLHQDELGPLDPRLAVDPAARILRSERFAVLRVARRFGADQIVIAPDERRGMDLDELLACKTAGFPVLQYLSFVEQDLRRVDLKRMELGWLLFSQGFQFSIIDRCLKRMFDVAVAATMLAATAPALALAMLAIRFEGPGPVVYRQERVTQGGRAFRIMKLRTMRVDAEARGAVWAAKNDSRITRVGAFLRRTRIDELPQLVNVLRGEMSFVGPRPERPVFVSELSRLIPLYNERHMVKAGLTGWAQVNYPYGASVDDARSKLSYDLYYVKNFSVLFDFAILLQTLRVVLWPSGVR